MITNIHTSQNRRFLKKKTLKYDRNIPSDLQAQPVQSQLISANSRKITYILYKLVMLDENDILLSYADNFGIFYSSSNILNNHIQTSNKNSNKLLSNGKFFNIIKQCFNIFHYRLNLY